MTLLRAKLLFGALLLLVSQVAVAHADDTASRGNADRLFNEAKALAEQHRYADACPKLEESQKLDPAIGTQFNLADCYEHLGRTGSAYRLFTKVANLARETGKFEREQSARARAATLESKVARLKLVVPFSAQGIEGLTIRADDQTVAQADWGSRLPVDPGDHRISATAPGRQAWAGSVHVEAGGSAEIMVEAPAAMEHPAEPPPPSKSTWTTQKTLAVVAAGVAVVGVAVGSAAGVIALSKHSDAEGECPSDVYHLRCPTPGGRDDWNAATSAGNVSTIGFAAGGAALAAAVILWLTAPSSSSPPPSTALSRARLLPMVSVRSPGLGLEGAF
jgi:hypothetical protein